MSRWHEPFADRTGYHSVVNPGGAPARFRIATYNIHRCRGLDGRTRPERIAAVLRSIDADVVALQEVVGAGPRGGGHAEELGALLGMGWVMAPARQLRGHQFGNAVLSRHPIAQHIEHDLIVEDVRAETPAARRRRRVDGCTLHLYNVHLGTAILERRHQARRLAAIVWDRHVSGPKLVLGDFNEWMRGLATTLLSEKLHSVDLRDLHAAQRTQRTYPGCSRSCISITSTTRGESKIVGVECRGRASRWSPRITCRSSRTCGSDRDVETKDAGRVSRICDLGLSSSSTSSNGIDSTHARRPRRRRGAPSPHALRRKSAPAPAGCPTPGRARPSPGSCTRSGRTPTSRSRCAPRADSGGGCCASPRRRRRTR